MNDYTFYWKDGKRDVFSGSDPANALNNAGYGGGAVAALDFYASGDNHEYQWDSYTRYWERVDEDR